MAIIKCKMCGGDLAIVDGLSVAECEYCGSRQTVPVADNEKKLIQFERAERLRRNCEFDKAAGLYEAIVSEFRQEAEAYWGLVLCKYGIEYVDDPATGRKIPTCHRSSFDSVMDDSNFDLAMENADEEALRVYRQEAKQIETIRRGILEVSSTEKPYDIFICYKETDSDGNRTLDSLLAQDIYDALNAKGYRVFFSRITLEDKLGQAYEPYIFAALNSAKIMLAVGTCYEHYNAVWVKNEWSRFLKIIAQDKGKYLIPCYKNIDAYDIPREFAHLQGQDMGKVGAMSDLLRGVAKILDTGKQVHPVKETVIVERPSSAAPLLRRAFLFLEDGDWESADEYCEKVLDQDPENALAYVGKLMVQLHVRTQDALKDCKEPFDKQNYYRKAIRFADEQLTAELTGYNFCIRERNETARKTELYLNAVRAMQKADTEEAFRKAADQFTPVSGFRDADALKQQCYENISALQVEKARQEEEKRLAQENQRKTEIYTNAVRRMQLADTEAAYRKAAELFASIPGFRDADTLAVQCMGQVAAIQAEKVRAAEEKVRIAAEKKLQQELNRQQAALAKQKRAEELAQSRARKELARNTEIYDNAVKRMETAATEGAYRKAAEAFASIPGFQDADARAQQCREQIQALREEKARTAEERARIAAEKKQEKNADDPAAIRTGKRNKAIAIVAGIAMFCVLWLLIPGLRAKEESKDVLQATEQTVAVESSVSPETEAPLTPEQIAYNEAEALLQDGETAKAAIAFGKLGDYSDARVRSFALWDKIARRKTFDCGYSHIVALRNDGTVVAVGSNEEAYFLPAQNVESWHDIIAVDADHCITVGLTAQGTVVTAYTGDTILAEVAEWKDIVAVAAGQNGTVVGLKMDGTVVVAGYVKEWNDTSAWTDIVDIQTSFDKIVGLKADGTGVSTAERYSDLADWKNVVSLDFGRSGLMGLTADGSVLSDSGTEFIGWENVIKTNADWHYFGTTGYLGVTAGGKVLSAGLHEHLAAQLSEWTDIADVYVAENRADEFYFIGLKKDGTIVTAGNTAGINDQEKWSNLQDISTFHSGTTGNRCYVAGLKKDGTLVTNTGLDTSDWTDIALPGQLTSKPKTPAAAPQVSPLIDPPQQYAAAEELLANGEIAKAAIAFGKLGDYSDARQRSFAIWESIVVRETVISPEYGPTIGLRNDGTVLAVGKVRFGQDNVSDWTDIVAVSVGDKHTVGLRSDGTVVAVGDNGYGQCDIGDWTDIVVVSASGHNTVGLRCDGTVLAVGDNQYGQCDVTNWTDIVAVSAGFGCTIGLKSDGSMVAVGDNTEGRCDVSSWTDIISFSTDWITVGLRSDGTVVATGKNRYGMCDVDDWTDIVAISSTYPQTVGLRSDGTVVAVGNNDYGQCSISDWTDIVAVSTGFRYTVGLRSDGTVVARGVNGNGECAVSDWTDIVAITAADKHTIGLRSDGTVIAVGDNQFHTCNVSDWTDIRIPKSRSWEEEQAFQSTVMTEEEAKVCQTAYAAAEDLLNSGETAKAAIAFGKLGDYSDARQRSFDLWNQVAQRDTIHNNGYTMAIKEDNTLLFSTSIVPGTPSMRKVHDTLLYQSTVVCQKNDLGEIVGVAPGNWHLDVYYLTSDGKVGNFAEMVEFNVPPEWDPNDYCDIHSLENIVAVSAVNCDRARGLLGLKCDGTVAFASWSDYSAPFDVQSWEDIIAVTAVGAQVFGLQTDGTVVTSGIVNPRKDLVIDVSDWKDIIAINGCSNHIIGLKSDGTVIAAGDNDYGECDVSAWTDIIAIDTDYYNTLGLKSDGTVVAVGFNNPGICNVEDWTDIVAISAGNPTIGLKQDGTVIALSYDRETSRKRISTWTDIKIPTNTRYQIHNDANH